MGTQAACMLCNGRMQVKKGLRAGRWRCARARNDKQQATQSANRDSSFGAARYDPTLVTPDGLLSGAAAAKVKDACSPVNFSKQYHSELLAFQLVRIFRPTGRACFVRFVEVVTFGCFSYPIAKLRLHG